MKQNAPSLSTLYLYITNRCNLNCRHCWIDPSYTNQRQENGMELKLLTDILEQSKDLGMRSLKITGGEPLLYDSFMGLMEYLKKKNWNLFLYMETNGTMIDRKMANALIEGGMKFVSVSIDGDKADTHDKLRGVKGSYEKAWQAVKFMVELGIPVQIITAVYRGNLGQFENVVKKAEALKAESVKANIINDMGRGAKMALDEELLSLEESLELNKKIETEYRERFKICVLSSMPVAFRSFKRMAKERTRFCKIKGLLGILASGKLSICGIGEEIEELIIGDTRKESIKEVWQKSPLLWSIRNDLPNKLDGVCKICIFKNYCLGHCVAQSYYSSGTLISPFWVCQKAYEKGLFPASRLLEGTDGTDKDVQNESSVKSV